MSDDDVIKVGDPYQPVKSEWGYAEGEDGMWVVVVPDRAVVAGEGTGVPIVAKCADRMLAEYIAFAHNTLRELNKAAPTLRGPQDVGEHTGGYL